MRITTQELHRNMLYVINNRYSDLADLQNQMSTGKRLHRPSDDPVDVANTLKLQTQSTELQQFKKNINDGLAFMGVAETAMESMNILIQRERELAIEAASDTLSSKERAYINDESTQLFKQCVALINTRYKGDYIFNGTQTKIPPYQIEKSASSTTSDYLNLKMAYFNAESPPTAVGDTVQIRNAFDNSPITSIIPGTFNIEVAGSHFTENVDYQVDYEAGTLTILNPGLLLNGSPGGPNYDISQLNLDFEYLTVGNDIYGQSVSNNGIVSRDIESNTDMQINIPAEELTTNNSTGTTLIGTLLRFGQNLLRNNNAGIETAITEIDTVFSSVLSAQSKNGARINRLETTLSRNENQYSETISLQSQLEDAEMAETISKFMVTQNVYNAALQSAAKIIQPSLANFL
ncbi:MAG TPA: flagellar hook-associated protein FlgL [Chitinispirillaceae bacterium]|nr:flagellar hook-associated protein FlgL [Chitinispirillaceae bacterium]